MKQSEELAARIRSLVAFDPRIVEKRMFGGQCFLLDGKILVAARGVGSLLVQCGSAAADAAVQQEGVSRMIMRGKPTANFIDVEAGVLETEAELRHWIEVAEKYVVSKPA